MSKSLRFWLDIPPVWMLAFLAVIVGQSRLWNPFGFHWVATVWLGWLVIGCAIVLMAWASLQFLLKRTSIIPRKSPKALIAAGPYRFSRNPIYLADAMVLLGTALILGSAIGVLFVPVFARVITQRFILGEEAGLKQLYPDQQAAFFANTRRWI